MNPYTVLGVLPDAPAADIKSAYRSLSKTKHPDQGGSEAEFNELKLAYDVLRDPERRRRYDETGVIDAGAADNRRAELLQYIAAKLVALVTGAKNPEALDLISALKSAIDNEMEAITKDRADAEGRKKRFEGVQRRLGVKKGKQNVLAPLIQQQIDAMTAHMTMANGALEMRKEARRVVGEHKFDPAAPEMTTVRFSPVGGGFWGGSSA